MTGHQKVCEFRLLSLYPHIRSKEMLFWRGNFSFLDLYFICTAKSAQFKNLKSKCYATSCGWPSIVVFVGEEYVVQLECNFSSNNLWNLGGEKLHKCIVVDPAMFCSCRCCVVFSVWALSCLVRSLVFGRFSVKKSGTKSLNDSVCALCHGLLRSGTANHIVPGSLCGFGHLSNLNDSISPLLWQRQSVVKFEMRSSIS